VCKEFAFWLKRYKKLMQKHMCEALEICCVFFWKDEPFRAVRYTDSYDRFFACFGTGNPDTWTFYALELHPSIVWEADGDFCTPITTSIELEPPRITTERIHSSGGAFKHQDKSGAMWAFVPYRLLGDSSSSTKISFIVKLDGVKISKYSLM
tara:strand:- start:9316 stop:9771 length:456 start_codon:yes stop_codon:yes gene_type:complete